MYEILTGVLETVFNQIIKKQQQCNTSALLQTISKLLYIMKITRLMTIFCVKQQLLGAVHSFYQDRKLFAPVQN